MTIKAFSSLNYLCYGSRPLLGLCIIHHLVFFSLSTSPPSPLPPPPPTFTIFHVLQTRGLENDIKLKAIFFQRILTPLTITKLVINTSSFFTVLKKLSYLLYTTDVKCKSVLFLLCSLFEIVLFSFVDVFWSLIQIIVFVLFHLL